jgi:hypothetical protein
VEALRAQAVYWSVTEPPKGDRLFERVFEIDARLGLPRSAGDWYFDVSRLQRAKGRDEALAILHDWLADLGDSAPTASMAALLALHGDRTALELNSRTPPVRVPVEQFWDELSQAVLASAQGRFDEAEQRRPRRQTLTVRSPPGSPGLLPFHRGSSGGPRPGGHPQHPI